MAHPLITAVTDRRLLAVGATAALFALPMAGPALALPLDETVNQVTEALPSEVSEPLNEAVEQLPVTPDDVPVVNGDGGDDGGDGGGGDDGGDDPTDPVTDVVNDILDEGEKLGVVLPEPIAEAVGRNPKNTDGSSGGDQSPPAAPVRQAQPASASPQPQPAPVPSPLMAESQAPAPAQSTTPAGRFFSQPSITSGFQVPQLANSFATSQLPTIAGSENATPVGVPADAAGWLVATAAGLLVLVAGGHVLRVAGIFESTNTA